MVPSVLGALPASMSVIAISAILAPVAAILAPVAAAVSAAVFIAVAAIATVLVVALRLRNHTTSIFPFKEIQRRGCPIYEKGK